MGRIGRTGAAVAVLVFLTSILARAQASSYDEMVDRLMNGDRTVDFTALRKAFTQTPAYTKEWANVVSMVRYRFLWSQNKTEDALKLATPIIAETFVDVNAHMVASLGYQQAGNIERAQFHRFVADGLLNSIRSSGDGKTKATAFLVIATNEEYALLVRAMRLRVVGVGTGKDGDHWYDDVTATDQTGAETHYIFNVDKLFPNK